MADAKITLEQVLHVAKLARLSLSDDEARQMQQQLDAILEYMAGLDELDVSDVLAERLFPTRIRLPDRIGQYYWRRTPTRRIPNAPEHRLSYAA